MAENYAIVNDDEFTKYAKQAEEEAKLASNNFGNSSFTREYENIQWTGLATNKWSVIRAVSGYPDSNLDNSTARTVNIAKIIDDNGKQMKVIRPSFTADPNYIINKIITAVKKTDFIPVPGQEKKSKVYPVQQKFPQIFNQIEKNGINPADKRAMFDKGWTGTEVLIMNVIDRSQMDWHRANKHTMLLAKSVNTVGDKEFVDEGISVFATMPKLRHYLTSYGSWEKYDLGIKRTGQKDNAYIIVQATKNPEELDEEARPLISPINHLTEEELSWERYDLSKLYRVTSNTKIYNRLKNTIKRIDEALGTSFLQELQKKVEEEKTMFAEIYKDEGQNAINQTSQTDPTIQVIASAPTAVPTTEAEIPAAAPTTAPVRRRATGAPAVEPWTLLPYGNMLPEYRRQQIVAVNLNAEKADDKITWTLPSAELLSCPTCQALAPDTDVPCCPVCGMDFTGTV